MATSFLDVYDRAIFKFKDYSFVDTPKSIKSHVLENYLMSTIADFCHRCVDYDLNDFDKEEKTFNVELNNEVIEILALGIAFHWISAEAMNQKLMRNRIFKSDYSTYSPANLMKAMTELRNRYESEYRSKMNEYSYNHSDI